MEIKELLQLTITRNASDLHLVAGVPPMLRVDGELVSIENEAVLTPTTISEMLKGVTTAVQLQKLTANKELDFSLSFSEKARFRVNAYTQKGSFAVAFRKIPLLIMSIDQLGLPKVFHSFTTKRQGLILVTGPTGHGKSTTLAALINEINLTRNLHIVTIEDPIEFVFSPVKSIISQREMYEDTNSWTIALRSVLREDPDVVLVGEMRDYETIAAALTVAETGHLVFATLHTNSAAETIDRIVDVFPDEQQRQVKLQLSNVIEAVISQRLIQAVGGGRIVATECMRASTAIKTAIREGKTHQITSIIQTSAKDEMYTMDSSLAGFVKSGKISVDTAMSYSMIPDELTRLIKA